MQKITDIYNIYKIVFVITNDASRFSLSKLIYQNISKDFCQIIVVKIQIVSSTTQNKCDYLALAIRNLRKWAENENRSSFRDSLRRRMYGGLFTPPDTNRFITANASKQPINFLLLCAYRQISGTRDAKRDKSPLLRANYITSSRETMIPFYREATKH